MPSVGQVIPELASAIGDASQAQRFVDLLNQTYGQWEIGGGGIVSGGACVLTRQQYQAFLAGAVPGTFVAKKPPPKKTKKMSDPVPLADAPQATGEIMTFEEWQDKRRGDETKKMPTKAKKKKAPAKAKKKADPFKSAKKKTTSKGKKKNK